MYLEYVSGGSLDARIQELGKLNPTIASLYESCDREPLVAEEGAYRLSRKNESLFFNFWILKS